jgi:hypothetical protein
VVDGTLGGRKGDIRFEERMGGNIFADLDRALGGGMRGGWPSQPGHHSQVIRQGLVIRVSQCIHALFTNSHVLKLVNTTSRTRSTDLAGWFA